MQTLYELNLLAHRARNWLRRAKLRRRLLELDTRHLEDIGYSRELLEQGVKAWPWRLVDDHAFTRRRLGEVSATGDRRSAAALGEPGRAHGDIDAALRCGRLGA